MSKSIKPAQLQRIESVDLALAKGGDPRAMQDVAAAAMNHYQRAGNLSDPNLRHANLALVRVGWLIGQQEKRPHGGDMSKVTRRNLASNAEKVWRHRQRTLYASLKWDTVVAAVDAALADGRVYWPSGKAPRAAAHDGNDEWYTPPEVIEAARQCMGGIDLDPASTAKANETVQAKAIYTVEDDGLIQPWHGRVFLNPPFSAQLKRAFCDRLRESVASGDVTQAVLVTPIDISPQWGDVIRTCASAVALAVGSTPFYGPRGERGGPGFGHMVSYYGPNVARFASVFDQEWSVWVRPTEH